MYKYRKPVTHASLIEAQMRALELSYQQGEEYHVYQDPTTTRYNTRKVSRNEADSKRGFNVRSVCLYTWSVRQAGWSAGLHKDVEDGAPVTCQADVAHTGMWPRYKGGLK